MTEEKKVEDVPQMLERLEKRSRQQSKIVAVLGGIVAVGLVVVIVLVFAVSSLSGSLNRRSVIIDTLNCYSTQQAEYNKQVATLLDAAVRDDQKVLAETATALKDLDPEKCQVNSG